MLKRNLSSYCIKYLIIIAFIEKCQISNAKKPEWVNDLLNYMNDNPPTRRQVFVITSEDAGVKIENYWINMMLIETMSNYPTYRIDEHLISHDGNWYKNETNSTGTLFLFVYDVLTPGLHSPKKIMDIMKELSLNVTYVSYLIIMLSLSYTDNFNELLRYSWEKRMHPLTIMELIHCREKTSFIKNTCNNYVPIIHNFNPFLNLMLKKNYEPGIDWFPNFMNNMHKYPLNVKVVNNPPLSLVEWNNDSEIKKMEGMAIYVMQEIANRMNFTPKILPKLSKKQIDFLDKKKALGIFEIIRNGKVDLVATLNPHYTQRMDENMYRTDTILIDELCALVPIIPAVSIPFPSEIMGVLILASGIAAVYWIAIHLFRFDKSWNIFVILRLLFGIPLSEIRKKMTLAQRTIIQTLIIISFFLSTNIYSSLTEISIETNSEVDISTFHDIDKIGLIPVISPFLWNKTFDYIGEDERILMNLKSKSIIRYSTWDCPSHAEKYENVTCLIQKIAATLISKERLHKGKPTLKIAKQCFWSDSYTFLVKPGSPYRKRINELLLTFAEVGLKHKWYKQNTEDFDITITNNKKNKHPTSLEEWEESKDNLLTQLIVILLFGMSAATIVFIGEISWFHGIKVLNRRRNFWLSKICQKLKII